MPDPTPVKIRIPQDLHEKLTAAAAKSWRSLHGEIIQRLLWSLGPEGTVSLEEHNEVLNEAVNTIAASALRLDRSKP